MYFYGDMFFANKVIFITSITVFKKEQTSLYQFQEQAGGFDLWMDKIAQSVPFSQSCYIVK